MPFEAGSLLALVIIDFERKKVCLGLDSFIDWEKSALLKMGKSFNETRLLFGKTAASQLLYF